ncbi:MAG: glycosyltransferase [Bacteroidetes bacterium]|nr:glycosyltransferase [Bacteroidota bacterium]
MKRLVFTVTNDLSFDQRMERICTSLSENGYEVELIGRKLKNSMEPEDKPYAQKRLKCVFNKGKWFYAEFNIRLFFFLLFKRFDIICCVDLDTLLAGFLIKKLRSKTLFYDAHELFTELPELEGRKRTKKIWQSIEKMILPSLKHGYTVNEDIAGILNKKYSIDLHVIRNMPIYHEFNNSDRDRKYILYQGAINMGRGLEQIIMAMHHIDHNLLIVGTGYLTSSITTMINKQGLSGKVTIATAMRPDHLREITKNAVIGVNILENLGLSYYHSLSNKFFDYLHAGVPSISSNFPEYARINEKYEVTILLNNLEEDTIVTAINKLLNDSSYYNLLHENCLLASKELNWQKEELKLLKQYSEIE